ncbi:MAG: hypothetical protein WCV84_04455 [Patescibacteria group bacterium]
MDIRQKRLEWISLVYLLFFVLAVLSPSLYRNNYIGIAEETLEEITIFIFGLAGIVTFTLYERLMERREKEREQVQGQYQKAKMELMESYQYIGSVNRKIELLKQVANDTTSTLAGQRHISKELFQSLMSNACSAVGAETALLRFVDHDRLRTDREFLHNGQGFVFRVANRDLRTIHERNLSHSFVLSEDEKEILVVPSDRSEGNKKAYLLLHLADQHIPEVDASLLKVFVNHAEMLYQHFPLGEISSEAPNVVAETPVALPQLVETPKSE